jgi:hypothetical protein
VKGKVPPALLACQCRHLVSPRAFINSDNGAAIWDNGKDPLTRCAAG